MTHKFAKHLIFAVSAVALTAMAANATTCDTEPSGNLPLTSSTSCTLGGLTFTWTQLGFTGSVTTGDAVSIITPDTGVAGDDYTLNFQYSGYAGDDILMTYEVTAPTGTTITGVDNGFFPVGDTAPPTGIGETVCTTATCGTVIATLPNTSGPTETLTFSQGYQSVWIIKDIQVGNTNPPGVSATSFLDSVVATPEPSSLGFLFMAGLGIVGAARKKFRKA